MQSLSKSYQEAQSGYPPVFRLAYCWYSVPYNGMSFLSFSKLWRATIKFEYKNWADQEEPFFFGWHSRKLHAVPRKKRSPLYVGVSE